MRLCALANPRPSRSALGAASQGGCRVSVEGRRVESRSSQAGPVRCCWFVFCEIGEAWPSPDARHQVTVSPCAIKRAEGSPSALDGTFAVEVGRGAGRGASCCSTCYVVVCGVCTQVPRYVPTYLPKVPSTVWGINRYYVLCTCLFESWEKNNSKNALYALHK